MPACRDALWIWPLLLGLAGCQGPDLPHAASPAPAAHERTKTLLVQLFGPVEARASAQDIFYGNPPPVVTSAKSVQLPLLVGIVLRGDKPEAFFVSGGQSHTGKEGDRIAGNYQIVRIDAAHVILEDLATGRKYRILMTGS